MSLPFKKKLKLQHELTESEEIEELDSAVEDDHSVESEGQDIWKWWEKKDNSDNFIKWRTLEHNGPLFPPPYEEVPSNIRFYYGGIPIKLSKDAEEVAGFYGKILDSNHAKKELFNMNFLSDWRKVMTPQEQAVITNLKYCNFKDFYNYYKVQTKKRKTMSKEKKQETKDQNEAIIQRYGYCLVDGHRQKINNFKIEAPGIFIPRGEHPKMGMLKQRIQPEDVVINIGRTVKVPDPPPGHKWKAVRHDDTVTWLCSWTENILGSTRYITLNSSSKLKSENELQKYEIARTLKKNIARVRKIYSLDLNSPEIRIRQRAVALYFIDKFALSSGSEKDESGSESVGCCSLRVEHLTLYKEKDGEQYVVDLDFLGKNNSRYFSSAPVNKDVFRNLIQFMEDKSPEDDLFDLLHVNMLNKFLSELVAGLTAKIFLAYNASKTFQEQLDILTNQEMSASEKLLAYNLANRNVAILCNHHQDVEKTFNKSIENLKIKIDDKIQQIREYKKDLQQLKLRLKHDMDIKDKALMDKKKRLLDQAESQLKKLEVSVNDKEKNKIALGSYMFNYLDPRISVAWCKKWNITVNNIYSRSQRDKYQWAIEMADSDFRF